MAEGFAGMDIRKMHFDNRQGRRRADRVVDGDRCMSIGSRVEHAHFGKGVVVETASEFYTIWFKSQNSAKSVSNDYDGLRTIEAKEGAATGASISLAEIEEALEHVLDRRLNEFQIVPMSTKWNNGTLILKPGEE